MKLNVRIQPPHTTPLPTPHPSLHHTPPYTTPLPTPHPSLHHTPPYTTPLPTPHPSLHHTPPYTTPLPTPHPSLHHTPPYHHTPTYYHTPINVFSNKLHANKFKSFGPPPTYIIYIYCPRVLVNLGGKHHCLL